MPNPDRLLTTINRAIAACGAAAGRQGKTIVLPAGAVVLVAGDLHGNLGHFQQLLDRADLKDARRHLVLQELIHGPFRYPLGGDKSHQLVDLLAALKCQYPHQVHCLLGNHELAQWTNRRIAKAELDLNDQFYQGVQAAYASRADEIYLAYLRFFQAWPLAVRTANRIFLSHSLPPAVVLESFDLTILQRDVVEETEVKMHGGIHALVWGRDVSPATADAFLKMVDADWLITGHIHSPQGFQTPNARQIILDCQASPGGYCVLETDRPYTHADLVACIQTL